MKLKLMDYLLNLIFFKPPKIVLTNEEVNRFNCLLENASNNQERLITYKLDIPKYKFLYYVTKHKAVLLHGSNHTGITTFEPFEQTLFNGKKTKAVFSTKDPFWSIFYAVFNRKSLVGNFRNGAISAGNTQYYHFYSLTPETMQNNPWTKGMIYLLPEESFIHVGKGSIQFDEWISSESVLPLAKLEVEPKDFYFIDKVSCHHTNESITKSWLLYKMRIFCGQSVKWNNKTNSR